MTRVEAAFLYFLAFVCLSHATMVMRRYHVFLANLHVTVGLRRGETMLPLPPKEVEVCSKNASEYIRIVLACNYVSPVRVGAHMGP